MFSIPIFLLVVPLLGAFLVYRLKNLESISRFLLTFSGAYLVSLVFMHILPDIYHSQARHTGIFILAGFFLQVLLDYTSKGIEHGHAHLHNQKALTGVIIGLYFHAFIESIPLGMGEHLEYANVHSLFWGIALHKLPVSIVLATLLFSQGGKTRRALMLILVFALIAPAGYFYGMYFFNSIPFGFEEMMAIVVGIFLHVGTTIIFETSESHRINFVKLIAIVAGFVLAGLLAGI